MQIQQEITIVGLEPSVLNFDGYQEDCTKVFALIDLDSNRGGRGQSSTVYKYKTSHAMGEFNGINLPAKAMATLDIVQSGKNTKFLLIDCKPLPPAKA